MQTVREERRGQVSIVTIGRPEVRNAVDGPTAEALADAFRRFDADPDLAVAVLTGASGISCAGVVHTGTYVPIERLGAWRPMSFISGSGRVG